MTKKELAIKWIKRKMRKESFFSYEEMAYYLEYHPKYLLKLKKEIEEGTVSAIHGNKYKKAHNAISEEEEKYIIY